MLFDEFFQPVKANIEREEEKGHYVVCVEVILEESSPENLQNCEPKQLCEVLCAGSAVRKSQNIVIFISWKEFLMMRANKRIMQLWKMKEFSLHGGLVKDKKTGRSSFVRQLEPDWHIDTNPEILFQLARFIKYQLHVSPTRIERTAANVFSSPSLEQFFGCI
ncbi:hypothetical protein NC653_022201 [Populus alba x Populus x berolinensis]|uniref:Uncharacterized protein n=1 Tax=Populus alba x Populus x berolinensis TaxID=444605 RepID=A0AAD6QFR4_9ROSI|nr:hypothetical protein NC653_022201 [Populus alba x Populus x berolinensis]